MITILIVGGILGVVNFYLRYRDYRKEGEWRSNIMGGPYSGLFFGAFMWLMALYLLFKK